MTILVFEQEGYLVATSSWSACSGSNGYTRIEYLWRYDNYQVRFNISMDEFLSRIKGKEMVDFREK